jgi:hypothetical protein
VGGVLLGYSPAGTGAGRRQLGCADGKAASVSHSQNLDHLIIKRLKYLGDLNYRRVELLFVFAKEVRDECEKLAEATGREAFRVMDGRLQALRKSGKIEYKTGYGWAVK